MPHKIELSPGRFVGEGEPCYLVAEVGQNHNGQMAIARCLVEEIALCGVDAVKFCKRDLSSELTEETFHRPYSGSNSFGATYGEHRKTLELSAEQHRELKQLAQSR